MLHSQTTCGTAHKQAGAYICYPNPAISKDSAEVPDLFHLSAQGNALPDHLIRRYVVFIDGRPVYQNRLALPAAQLSIETNIQSPFRSGAHTLGLFIEGAGSAEVPGIQFHPASHLGFCDAFSRLDPRACLPHRNSTPLTWSLTPSTSGADLFGRFADLLSLYSQNLARAEADIADAMMIDGAGNLYTASHSSSDLEIRKYLPDGSIVYDHLVRFCGPGFASIVSLVTNESGRLWLAGNTTACLPSTSGALLSSIANPVRPRGFVLSVDTQKSDPASLVFATWLAPVDYQISSMRVDATGNTYLAGNTNSAQFPHDAMLTPAKAPADLSYGFVAVLNPSGSGLLSSALLPDAQFNALAIDHSRNIYITGRSHTRRSGHSLDAALIVALAENGRRVKYLAHFGTSGIQEGRAIAVTDVSPTRVVVTGQGAHPFALALEACKSGRTYSQILSGPVFESAPELAVQPALDAFAASLGEFAMPQAAASQNQSFEILAAADCRH